MVLHQEISTPGRVGHYLQAHGIPLDIRRPALGCPLPETLERHAGVVVFGGPMSANDETDFIRREIDWLSVPLKERKPFLGICLGAQMLARHLGARVCFHPEGLVEIGYYPLHVTAAGRAVCDAWPSHVYQWHREGFELPAGAELLAEGDTFAVQAFRYGPAAYGVQFHAEVTYAMMCQWTTRGHARMELPGAQSRSEHYADRPVYDPAIRRWLTDFLDQWIGARVAA
jgi:GMP synthase (glutamine-hydrolysing)